MALNFLKDIMGDFIMLETFVVELGVVVVEFEKTFNTWLTFIDSIMMQVSK